MPVSNPINPIAGVVAEYDPFHNGHLYHLHETLRNTGGKAVAVISGGFTQRGEPSLLNKAARAEAALLCGFSVVFMLPAACSCAAAEIFAAGGVGILDAIGADYLSFGAENPELPALQAIAGITLDEPPEYKAALKEGLSSGLSFAAARTQALRARGFGEDLLKNPNNILAIEYLKAIKALDSRMIPVPVKRSGAAHNADAVIPASGSRLAAPGASASYLRKRARAGDISALRDYMPPESFGILEREHAAGRFGPLADDFASILHYTLIREKYNSIMRNDNNFERMWRRAAMGKSSVTEIADAVSGRYFTKARARRAVFRFILGLPPEDAMARRPAYARVLGFRREDAGLLSRIVKQSKIPVVTNLRPGDNETLRLDLAAEEIYGMGKVNGLRRGMVII
ncbi:MAG: nucleotidyltransferase family protein [Clostridiales bacterium]|jgi:predicted nucleotidyltransferase|nr:nucleotidyltransferase family protein [Clostridiales bacterium]